jgi:hypothetical protein
MADTEAIPRGTVFLVEEDAGDGSGQRAWCGYWDASPEGRGLLEDAGRHHGLASALAWARARSARVLVRYEGAGDYLWAGEGAPPAGVLPLQDPEDKR